jgi:acetylornithine deacetylase/succinyl-diaminopimelate desuccinylase-like protein
VIPSEAIATLDVRALPGENMTAFLETVRKVVDDPTVEVRFGQRDTRPAARTRASTRTRSRRLKPRRARTTTRRRCRR